MKLRRPYCAAIRRWRAARPYRIAALFYIAVSLTPIVAGDAREVGSLPGMQIAQAPVATPPSGALDAKTIEKYGTALSLGDRAAQFAPEITAINQAVQSGDSAAVAAAVKALYAKAKRPVPEGDTLAKLIGQLPAPQVAATDAAAPPRDGPGLPPPPASGSAAPPSISPPGTSPPSDLATSQPRDPGGADTASATGPNTDTGGSVKCKQPEQQLAADQLVGVWSDADGGSLDISLDPNDKRKLIAAGAHRWEGSFQNGQVTFSRNPSWNELTGDLPQWAKTAVEGKVRWRLVLAAKEKCGTARLEGKWFPQTVKLTEEYGPDDRLVRRQATVVDEGAIDVSYEIVSPSKMILYAVTGPGSQNIKRIFLGVSTIIELQFDPPYPRNSYPVKIEAGKQAVSLTATRVDNKGYIFRTPPFIATRATLPAAEQFSPPLPRGASK